MRGHRKGRRGDRAIAATRVALIAGIGVSAAAAIDHGAAYPLLFTSLGPTAYQLSEQPAASSPRVRFVVLAHAVAIVAGLVALAIFGLWSAPNLVVAGHASAARIGAVGLALALALGVLEWMRVHHAAAGSTALVVATGIAGPWRHVAGLVAGLAVVIAWTATATALTGGAPPPNR